MKLTIAYLTFRLHPRFEWFASSLAREFRSMPDVDPNDVQVVCIDGRLWHEGAHRHLGMLDAAGGKIRFEHYPPKPSPWQGPSRQTSKDYFCAASVRNTAFAYARNPHVAFVDDLSVLLPGWLKAHVHAALHGYVLCGTTCKMKNLSVTDEGEISAQDFPPGRDSRLPRIGAGLQTCEGSWLFGGTFSVPLGLALAVNGQDEITNIIGGEDYDFGIRLQRAGAVVRITKDCGTYEDEDGHHTEAPMVRLDKPWPGFDGPYASNRMLNCLQREVGRSWTVGNGYKLVDLRSMILAGGSFPEPEKDLKHWVDGQNLRDM